MTIESKDWAEFFCQYAVAEKKAENQKARGLNDYSLINSLLKIDDEVRLHSRFLYSMLNPESKHYQGVLFLELFLKSIGRSNWLDVDKANVSIETKIADLPGTSGYIDIYINDGTRHIVIENKINAEDQKEQLKRYIDQVRVASSAESKDILFVYLSKGRAKPDAISFGSYSLSNDHAHVLNEENAAIADYLSISFKDEIQHWISQCLKETENLTNLNHAFKEYKQIIDKLTKKYRSNVMGLDEFLTQETDSKIKKNYLEAANTIALELPKLRAQWCKKALIDELEDLLTNQYSCTLLTEKTYPKMKGNRLTEDTLKRFFSNKNGGRNNYLLFSITTGEHANKLGLLIILAASFLYIGFVSLRKGDDDIYISGEDTSLLDNLQSSSLTLSQYGLEANDALWVPKDFDQGFKSYKPWRIEANVAALDLHDFNNSGFKKAVEFILKPLIQ